MAEFLAMGGYGQYVWSVFALGVITLTYNVVSARRRMRIALENAALNAARIRNRPQPPRNMDGNEV